MPRTSFSECLERAHRRIRLQNLLTQMEHAQRIWRMFGLPDERIMIDGDFSDIERRVMESYTGVLGRVNIDIETTGPRWWERPSLAVRRQRLQDAMDEFLRNAWPAGFYWYTVDDAPRTVVRLEHTPLGAGRYESRVWFIGEAQDVPLKGLRGTLEAIE